MNLVSNFRQIIVNESSLIDVRAPVEFIAGSLPGSVNLPLMDDEERHKVGLCFKKEGGEAAVALGNSLVAGEKKEERIDSWKQMVADYPDTILYCFRGGLRSDIVQKWLRERAGIEVPRVEGGYKRFRNYLLASLDPASLSGKPVVLGGRTGSGKTILLNQLENSVDLEAIANHRGSSFGRFITSQPTQVDFENRLAAALIMHEAKKKANIVVEDEGRHVGRCYLPRGLSDFFADGKLVVLETPIEKRVEITFNEYVIGGQLAFCTEFGEDGLSRWHQSMEENGNKIAKRLGGEGLKRMKKMLGDACRVQLESGNSEQHKSWVEMLITEYYDPMYDYQLEKDNREIIFSGDASSVIDFFQSCP